MFGASCTLRPTLFDHFRSLWPGTVECISLTGIFNDLLFKIAVRSDRLFILVSGFLDSFFTAFDLRTTNRGTGLNFKELVYGRIKMMTVLCPAWAHTYQTMCLGFLGLQPRSAPAFCFSAAQDEKTVLHATYLPYHYQNDWYRVSWPETFH